MNHRSTPKSLDRARWRTALVACLLVSLVWPAIGPMPWLFDPFFDRAPAANADPHDAIDHRHHDASDIPGSPTHPDDHNCFQCDVIKHLARCVPSDGCYPVVASVTSHPPRPSIHSASIRGLFVVLRPPIRGPPSSNG